MKKFDNIWVGAIIGVATSMISILVFYFLKFTDTSLADYLKLLAQNRYLFAPIVSLAGVPNLAIFFIFINRDKYKSARGIILATFILVVVVLIIKFLK